MPLHGVYPVFMIEQLAKVIVVYGVGKFLFDAVGNVVVGNRTLENGISKFGKHSVFVLFDKYSTFVLNQNSMQLHYLSTGNSVLNHFLAQIRHIKVQGDSMRFRRNIERIGEVMAFEMSKNFDYQTIEVLTPLGTKTTTEIANKLVLCSILRAGLPLHLGFLNYFDNAENGFVSAYRLHENGSDDFEIKVEYQAVPEIDNKTLILIDPMLATGQSIVAVLEKLLEKGTPTEVHLAVVIAAPEGVAFLEKMLPENYHLWVATLDSNLNEKNYIVPGLGDAGDLAYGNKL
jgi:uracil phosphoribosyltransferase